MEDNNTPFVVEQRESIKLTRSVTGKVGWDLKILNTEGKQINDSDIRRLDELNKLMVEKYGSNE